jgi:cathepsin B
MISRLLFAFLLLFAIGSHAQMFKYTDMARANQHLEQLKLSPDDLVLKDSRKDIVDFTAGFLLGIQNAALFDDIKACITDDEAVMTDITNGIILIMTKTPDKVKEGIRLLGEAAQMIPAAAKDCKIANDKIQKIIDMVNTFTDPKAFLYHVGKSLLINHVEVLNEINGAVKGYQDKNMNRLGYWVGAAMATIFLKDKRPLRDGTAELINEVADWEATNYKQFEGMTIEEIKGRFLGASMIDLDNLDEGLTVMNYEGMETDIPDHFSSSEKWSDCIHPIRDQQHCGSCWAFAATEVLSDRFCISSNNKINVVLSPQYLLSCDTGDMGCNGGWPVKSWDFIMKSGLLTDTCLPYQSGSGKNPVKCKAVKKCTDGSEWKLYYAKKGSSVVLPNPVSIQNNILQFGPVEAAFQVYEDFIHYKSGIYKHTSGGLLGGHAVKIVGWGKEDNTDYWIVANSWNTTWGENGFFRIAFGQVGIDKGCIAGEADIERLNQSNLPSWW